MSVPQASANLDAIDSLPWPLPADYQEAPYQQKFTAAANACRRALDEALARQHAAKASPEDLLATFRDLGFLGLLPRRRVPRLCRAALPLPRWSLRDSHDDGALDEREGTPHVEGVSRDLADAIADALLQRGVFLPALMTVEEATRALHIEDRVVRRWIAQGRIPATKLGKRWVIPRDALIRVVEERAMRNLARSPLGAGSRAGDL